MVSNYYYIISSLPDLVYKEGTDYSSFTGLFDETRDALSNEDKEIFRYIQYQTDNRNLIHLMDNEADKFMEGGNYSLDELKYEMKAEDTIPGYMQKFFEEKKAREDNSYGKIELLNSLYYFEVLGINNKFTRKWFGFERDLKNVLTALECRKHNEPIERREVARADQRPGQRMIGEYEVTHNILFNKALDYSLSGILPWMIRVMDFNSDNLLEYERDIFYLKMEVLSDLYNENSFSLETILAYFVRLQLFLRWSRLNEEKGNQLYKGFLEKSDQFMKEAVFG